MNRVHSFGCVAAFLLSQLGVAQTAPAKKTTLVVNGHTAPGVVLQIDGRSYMDIEAFAQTAGATVSLEPGKVIVTLATPNAASPTPTQPTHNLTREFAQAAIAAVSDMREWRGAISSSIRYGVAAGNWLAPFLQEYQTRSYKSLSEATLAAKTGADQKAVDLLKNEFNNLKQWDGQTQATIQSLNAEATVNPAAAEADPLRIKISDCSHFLDSMLVSGEFADDLNCH